MQRIKINIDPKAFYEDGSTIAIKLDTTSGSNALIVSDGVLSINKATRFTSTNANKVGNGIAGTAHELLTTVVGCCSTVSRRKKYDGSAAFVIENEGPYMADVIRAINPYFGYDEGEIPDDIIDDDEGSEVDYRLVGEV